ncbi:MAG: D-alanyl-D-alanine carboxypeptidase/D-alanyl-D-alanine-endopeptidase [Candidatus Electrothrix sp. YB6]
MKSPFLQIPAAGIFCLILTLLTSAASAACPSPFSKLIRNGGYGVSDRKGRIIAACNPDTPYVPASLFKISTALAAQSILGPDYRFTTEFYTDSEDNLFIKGWGDPMLVSEEIQLIFAALKTHGVQRINGIFADPSNFALEHRTPGREDSHNPYDAPVGAVSVNFNTVAVRITKKGGIVSGEKQTPMLPIMRELAKGYGAGWHRINICREKCNEEERITEYTTELFRALQKDACIPGKGKTGVAQVPSGAKLVYTHQSSKTLHELVVSFLKHSSNFIANLVYLTCGAKKFGYPATWAKAEQAVNAVLVEQLGKKTAAAFVQKEGAGLYRGNWVTVRAMLELLRVFRPYASLMRRRRGVRTKSGTMKGIYNYAGYLDNGNAYVILLNQKRNQRRAVLDLLKKGRYGKRRKNKKK